MKRIFLLLVILISFVSVSFAYTPTLPDLQQIITLRAKLDQIVSWNNLDTWNFYSQIRTLKTQFNDEKLNYILDQLNVFLISKLETEKAKAKESSKQFKQDFLTQYMTGLQEITTADTCAGRYNTLDNISFANNFPTALTIATWYRESNCGYYLPSNGDGPFQILTKDYGTGAINEGIFFQAVQDFIDFSQTKYANYKTKLGIVMTYTWFDFTWIIDHAWLYNGWTITWWIVRPNNPHYVRDGYGDQYSWAIRYGLVPKFLKTLNREIQTQY